MKDKSVKKIPLKSLAAVKRSERIRTLGDFIEGLDASAVTIAFAEEVPALQKGVADCGITGTMPAYNAKWWQVVTHNIRVRVGYAATFTAMNMDTWKSLNPETQQLIMDQGNSSKTKSGRLQNHLIRRVWTVMHKALAIKASPVE